jgi:carboxyl-terminal processing protease
MFNKTKVLLHIPVAVVFILSIFLSYECAAEEKTDFEPLFPIDLKHDFPKSKEVFEEVKELILNNYYSDKITEEILYWAAVKGMLRHISPPSNPDLAKIWTSDEYEIVENTLHGEQVSIGIKSTYNAKEGSLTISEIFPGSPAEGLLKPMDRILRVNSQPLKNRSINDVNNLLKGEEGKEITLTINRDIEILEVKIIRKKFETQNLIITQLTDRMLLVEIKKFTLNISKELEEELIKYRNSTVQSVIIDLRNNTGGILSEALKIVELFLPEKHILLRTVQRETGLQNYVSGNKEPFNFDVAILANKKTASSAEIMASALQDHQKALIVGIGTYGKAVFEKTFTLKNDYHVKFITGAMYSPKGKSWQGKGIVPDFLVEQNNDTLNALMKLEPKKRFQKDVAMITAYKLLNRRQGDD